MKAPRETSIVEDIRNAARSPSKGAPAKPVAIIDTAAITPDPELPADRRAGPPAPIIGMILTRAIDAFYAMPSLLDFLPIIAGEVPHPDPRRPEPRRTVVKTFSNTS